MKKEIQEAGKFDRWHRCALQYHLHVHSPAQSGVYIHIYSYSWFRLFLAFVKWYICAFSCLLLLYFLATLVTVLHMGAVVYCHCLHKLCTHSVEHFCFLYTLNLLWSLVSYIFKLLGYWIFSSWFCAVVLWTIYYWWLWSRHARLPPSGCLSPTGVLNADRLRVPHIYRHKYVLWRVRCDAV